MHRDRKLEDHRLAAWAALPLLAGCSRRQLEQVDGLGTQVDIGPGRRLTSEGTPGRECFLVLAGTAAAERDAAAIGTILDGTVAGELALLDGIARSATVVSRTTMRLLVLTPPEFAELLEAAPCVQDRVLETAAVRRAALDQVAAR
jgi:CRP/FNR family transcriptional regulator, cyclic AMP receptor protein